MNPVQLLRAYYLATIVFLALDLILGINVRIAFFEGSPALRALYYAICLGCAGLMYWRPALTVIIGAFESLFACVALILSFGLRTMLVSDTMLETGTGVITMPELFNFLLAATIGYFAWMRGMRDFFENRDF